MKVFILEELFSILIHIKIMRIIKYFQNISLNMIPKCINSICYAIFDEARRNVSLIRSSP